MNLENNISRDNFEQCIKCTICTVYCPVMAVNSNYPGPKQAGPDGERYRLKNPKFFDEALKYCMNCKRCEVACPSNVKIGDIIQNARLEYSKSKPGLRELMLANTDFMGTLATSMAPVVNFTLGLPPVKAVMHSVLAIDKHREFPKYTGQRFVTWFAKKAKASQENFTKFVTYFHGCYANYNNPKLAIDFVQIMNALGYGVHLMEKEKCCGVALIANGQKKQAVKQAKTNLSEIRKALSKDEVVLTTSSTCTFTIRDEYEHILGLENQDVRNSVVLATRFLYKLLEESKVQLVFKEDYRKKIAYHTPCHMEKLGWSIYSINLLKMIPGLDFITLDSQCCGIAGTYGYKRENYKYSQKIGDGLFRQISEVSPDLVATDCETCKFQIEMSTSVKVENPISILADALDLEATSKLNNQK